MTWATKRATGGLQRATQTRDGLQATLCAMGRRDERETYTLTLMTRRRARTRWGQLDAGGVTLMGVGARAVPDAGRRRVASAILLCHVTRGRQSGAERVRRLLRQRE